MKFNRATRAQIVFEVQLSFDPTDSDVEAQIDGDDWVACTWDGSPEVDGLGIRRVWSQLAHTDGYYVGPDGEGAGTALTAGLHQVNTRVSPSGGGAIVHYAGPLDVT